MIDTGAISRYVGFHDEYNETRSRLDSIVRREC